MTASVRNYLLILLVSAVACGDVEPPQQHGHPQGQPRGLTQPQKQARPQETEYATSTFALMPNPVECPPAGANGDPDQPPPTCTDENGVAEVEPRCFVPLGDPLLRREIAQRFTVNDVGVPGRLFFLLSHLQEVPYDAGNQNRIYLQVEIRDLGVPDPLDPEYEDFPYDENINIPLDSQGSKVAEGMITRKQMAQHRDVNELDKMRIVNLTGIDPDTNLFPNHIYAVVFLIPEDEVEDDPMSVGIGCHEGSGGYEFSAYTRQMRQLGSGDFTDPQFIQDTRTIVFSLTLDDGCTNGAMLECGIGDCFRNDWPLCNLGEWNDECEPLPPSVEVCDGRDNSCNGLTDDGLGTKTCGTGVCSNEVPFCENGVEQTCTPNAPEAEEVCDGKDNTCDGMTDVNTDGTELTRLTCGIGACYADVPACKTIGSITVPNTCTPLPPQVEQCNGIDDNCNGTIDRASNGFPIAESYYELAAGLDINNNTIGECRYGQRQCANPPAAVQNVPEPPVWTVLALPKYPTTETCDGLDNDCNGIVDNGGMTRACYTGPLGTEYVGTCHGGTNTCIARLGAGDGVPQWTAACAGQVTPTLESCNGLDDNCNGVTDDGFADIYCGVGQCRKPIGACIGGVNTVCDDYAAAHGMPPNDPTGLVTQALPGWPLKPGIRELCNGLDDTCDGRVDVKETYAGSGVWVSLTQECDDNAYTNIGECRTGTQTCAAGSFGACVGAVPPAPNDVCNGKDDNCNGVTDETPCGPLANASVVCNGSLGCQIGTCNLGYYNYDGSHANGCECKAFNDGNAATCGNAGILSLAPGTSSSFVRQGNMASGKNAEHWYAFRFERGSVSGRPNKGAGRPTIQLTGASQYSMQIYYDSCTGAKPSVASPGVGIRNGTSNISAYGNCSPAGTGRMTEWDYHDDCQGKPADGDCSKRNPSLPEMPINLNSRPWPEYVYVKVYRTDSAPAMPSDCLGYILTAKRL